MNINSVIPSRPILPWGGPDDSVPIAAVLAGPVPTGVVLAWWLPEQAFVVWGIYLSIPDEL